MQNLLRAAILTVASITAVGGATLVTPSAIAANNDMRLRARLAGESPASGKADYRERTKNNQLEQRFSVQVEDAAPEASLAVIVNGVQVGLIFTDALGFGEIQFRTEAFIDDPGDGDPIPTEFPRLQPGDSVQVGDFLFGSFGA